METSVSSLVGLGCAKEKSIVKMQTDCKSLISYGSVYSTVGIRLNPHSRNTTELNSSTREQIVGHLLGDGTLFVSHTSKNPSFRFIQSNQKFEYMWSVFNYLSHLCERVPDFLVTLRNGTVCFSLRVRTRSYAFFNDLHNLFYIKEDGKWVKVINDDIIHELTPRALAF